MWFLYAYNLLTNGPYTWRVYATPSRFMVPTYGDAPAVMVENILHVFTLSSGRMSVWFNGFPDVFPFLFFPI